MIRATQFPASAWRKSSHSGPNQGECLEVADGFADVPVRDSKVPAGPALIFGAAAFSAFVGAVKSEAFDA